MTSSTPHHRTRTDARSAVWLVCLALGVAAVLTPAAANAKAPTLLEWNYLDGGEGGPNLDEPIVTDRPDFTEASSTVGQGVLQIESGYTFFLNDDGAEHAEAHSYPEALFRLGVLADWLELRLAWSYLAEEVDGDRSSGADDLYLGAKLGLTGQAGILPEMALVPQSRVPTGAGVFTADEVLPGVNWLYGWDVTEIVSTGGSTQYNRRIDGESLAAYAEWAQSWTINYAMGEHANAYTEWFALFPHSADTEKPQHYFDGGFAVRITNDIQWDIRAGVGLNEAADDLFAGTGLSLRFH